MIITLKNLHEATAQQVFTQAATHLLTQKVRSGGGNKACLYRDGELKCAAGCFIADDEYQHIMDSGKDTSWRGLIERDLVPTKKHVELITQLQNLHDVIMPSAWREALENVAVQYKLEMPKV